MLSGAHRYADAVLPGVVLVCVTPANQVLSRERGNPPTRSPANSSGRAFSRVELSFDPVVVGVQAVFGMNARESRIRQSNSATQLEKPMSFPPSSKCLAAALMVALAPVSASAQAVPSDAKCFLLSNMFANSTDAKAKQAAGQAVMFYLGRLTGPTARVEASLAAEAKTISAQTAGATMQVCVQALAQRAKDIQGINERLKAQAKK